MNSGASDSRPSDARSRPSADRGVGGTRLRLTPRALPADLPSYHGLGWDYALPRLATVAAGRDPGPDPLRSIVRGTLMVARSLPPRYLYRFGRRRLRTRTSGRPQR